MKYYKTCGICNGSNIVVVGVQLGHDGNIPVFWCDRCGTLTFGPEWWTQKMAPAMVPLLSQGTGAAR